MRPGVKFGDVGLEDSLITDGLTDAFLSIHMGVTAENVAKKWNLTREEQDEFAARSQQRAGDAMRAGHFSSEIVPVSVPVPRKPAVIVSTDEFPRPDTTAETLAKLRPAFVKDGTGSVTAGNASGINDGAAAVLVMSADEASRRNLSPLARIVCTATAGVDPALMGAGPIPAVRAALAKAGWTVDQVDLWELNEAFASQSLAVVGLEKFDDASFFIEHPTGERAGRRPCKGERQWWLYCSWPSNRSEKHFLVLTAFPLI